ncbi:hypothetical protein HXX76_008921 [Chlamydomonas incerta]|uniref:Protein kinase domain-containing protein n=1 Tax=Chlamydomonas incerta TaxID=51695 RepID=A0A835SSK6_CHLIN|nr:hypothetical protein HXX76_008921 [Chlamydomonas incerta]|eukprot:KAG2432577.1 hypothetical protein HXX76_008921 [Chlamydomonas incerta]
MPPGTYLKFQQVVIDRWREPLYLQAPGMDLLGAWPGPKPADPIQAPQEAWSFLVLEDMALISRACLEPGVALAAVTGYARPAWAPGVQAITPNIAQPGCVPAKMNDTDASPNGSADAANATTANVRLSDPCYPQYTRYDDVVLPGYDMYANAPRPVLNGYMVLLRNNLVKCQALLDGACIKRLGAVACFRLLYPSRNGTIGSGLEGNVLNGTQAAAPAASPPASGTVGGGGGSGPHSSVVLGAVLGGVLGGCAVIMVAGVLVWLHRQRRRQAAGALGRGQPGKAQQPDTGPGSAGLDSAAFDMDSSGVRAPGAEKTAAAVMAGQHDNTGLAASPVPAGDRASSGTLQALATAAREPSLTAFAEPAGPPQVVVVTARTPLQPGIPLDVVVMSEQRRALPMDAAAASPHRAIATAAAVAAGGLQQLQPPLQQQQQKPGVPLDGPPPPAGVARPGLVSQPGHTQAGDAAAVPGGTGAGGCVLPSPPALQGRVQQPQPERVDNDGGCTVVGTSVEAEAAITTAPAPFVTLLPVLRGKGTFGRVVEGLYCGQRVAVKLLNTGLTAAAAEAPSPAAQQCQHQAQVVAGGADAGFDVAGSGAEPAAPVHLLNSGLNMLTVPGMIPRYSSGSGSGTPGALMGVMRLPQPHQWPHQQLPPLPHWPPRAPGDSSSSSDGGEMVPAGILKLTVTEAAVLSNRGTIARRGAATPLPAAPHSPHLRFSHSDPYDAEVSALGLFGPTPSGTAQQAPLRWGPNAPCAQAPLVQPPRQQSGQLQSQQQQSRQQPQQQPQQQWVWMPLASDETQSTFTREDGGTATATPTATGTASDTNGDGASPLAVRQRDIGLGAAANAAGGIPNPGVAAAAGAGAGVGAGAGERKQRLLPAAAAAAITTRALPGGGAAACRQEGAEEEGLAASTGGFAATHGERWELPDVSRVLSAEHGQPQGPGSGGGDAEAAADGQRRGDVGKRRDGAGGAAVGAAARMQLTFVQEVQILARIEHPCIVKLLAACLQPPQFALVFELMDTSLDRVLYGGGNMGPGNGLPPPYYCPYSRTSLMPLDKVLHIAAQIARALEYLHPTIIHRDLKPGNVLLSDVDSRSPVVKLADFGLSRLQSTVLVTCNVDVGTAAYMAPETLNAMNRVVTHHVDMYALGVMLWEMLSGQRPWTGANMVQIACAVGMRNARPPLAAIPEGRCPPALQQLIAQCWDVDPARRPAASEAYKELVLLQHKVRGGAAAGPGESEETEVCSSRLSGSGSVTEARGS